MGEYAEKEKAWHTVMRFAKDFVFFVEKTVLHLILLGMQIYKFKCSEFKSWEEKV